MSVLLFTGHRLDPVDRPTPRFTSAMVPSAQAQIRKAITELESLEPISGAVGSLAAGADLLFAEAVLAARISLHAFLPLPEDAFITTSVAYATEPTDTTDWLARYLGIQPQVTTLHEASPPSAAEAPVNAFAACNLRMLAFAQQLAAAHRTMVRAISYFSPLAEHAGQPGGSADFTQTLLAAGVPVHHLIPQAD